VETDFVTHDSLQIHLAAGARAHRSALARKSTPFPSFRIAPQTHAQRAEKNAVCNFGFWPHDAVDAPTPKRIGKKFSKASPPADDCKQTENGKRKTGNGKREVTGCLGGERRSWFED
jgi:hypothetical protein